MIRRARIRYQGGSMPWFVTFDPPVGGYDFHAFYRWDVALEFTLGVLRGEPCWTDQIGGAIRRPGDA